MFERQEPAIVRSVVSVKETISQLKSMNAALVRSKEEIGRVLLKLKNACLSENMSFLEAVEKTGIHERSARRYMELVKKDEYLGSLGESDNLSGVCDKPSSNLAPPKPSANGHQSRDERLGLTKPTSYVETHAIPSKNGHYTPMLPPMNTDVSKNGHAMREPGDDTEVIEAEKKALREQPKNGRVVFDWKVIEEPFGKLIRSIDLLGNAFHCKESAKLNAAREQLSSVYSSLQAIYQHKGI